MSLLLKNIIRFNLGLGKNYKKWRIRDKNGVVSFYDPNIVTIIIYNGLLVNHRGVANKIYNGGHKVVCAWVSCDDYEIIGRFDEIGDDYCRIYYDPRKTPNWLDWDGTVIDRGTYSRLVTIGNTVNRLK